MKCVHCKRRKLEKESLSPWALAYYRKFGIPETLAVRLCHACLKKQWRRELRKAHNKRPKYRISRNIANGMRRSLHTGKEGYWESVVGYTLARLKKHLEKRFKPGMTWANYGQWHIDHIRPVVSFDFSSTDSDAFRQCWALKNLRPLWARDNWRRPKWFYRGEPVAAVCQGHWHSFP
jgi:hypothetical protein